MEAGAGFARMTVFLADNSPTFDIREFFTVIFNRKLASECITHPQGSHMLKTAKR